MVLNREEIQLNDDAMGIGSYSREEFSTFGFTELPSRLISYDNNYQISLTFELSQTRNFYTRSVYRLLDFMGDIGGLFSAISPIATVLVAIF